MGKAEDKRAAIVAAQAAREAAEKEARKLAGPATPQRKRKPRPNWAGGGPRRGTMPPKDPE
jgi:hypothetical protein